MKYAAGKRAWGICDRSGLRYPLKDLVPQYRNGVKTGLLVGRDQVDEDHPQNFIGRARTDDAQALRNPRPETTNGREIALRVSYLQGVTGRLTHGVVGFTIDTDADAAPAGLSATVGMGDVSVRADQVFSVTGAQIGSATQSVSVGAGVSVEVTPAGMGLSAVLGTVNAASSLNIIPAGLSATVDMGDVSVRADQVFSVTGAQIGSATQSVGADVSVEVTPAGMGLSAVLGTVNAASSLNITPDGIAMSAVQGSSSAHADADAELAGMGISASMGGAVAGLEILYNTSAVTGGGYLGFGLMLNGSYVDTGTTFRGPAITVVRGNTYRFQHGSSDLYNNRRLFISTTDDGSWGGGSQYTAGWTEDGGNLTRIWTIPASAPDTMYYYSPDGATAGNTITVTD